MDYMINVWTRWMDAFGGRIYHIKKNTTDQVNLNMGLRPGLLLLCGFPISGPTFDMSCHRRGKSGPDVM